MAEGIGISFTIVTPGLALITLEIELTIIAAVAISPAVPLLITVSNLSLIHI